MKKFISRLILFSLPFVLFLFAADVMISRHLKKSNSGATGEYSVWNDIYDGKINAGIVIYGSSRAWIQIDPAIISNAFNTHTYNLGIDGHGVILEYFRHTLLLKYNTTPKVIIYSLDRNTLAHLEDLYNEEQFLPYMLFDLTIRKATTGFNGFNLLDYLIPSFRYLGRRTIVDKAFEAPFNPATNEKYRINGYKGMDEQWNNDFEKAKYTLPDYRVNIDPNSILLFNRYLKECKEKNIKNIFVYTPEYIDGQKYVKNRDTIMHIFMNFAKKYHIPFYDYSNDSISFQKKYFYNSEHLNSAGSELFTKEFVADLQKDGYVGDALQK